MVHPQHQKRGIATRFMDAVRQKVRALSWLTLKGRSFGDN